MFDWFTAILIGVLQGVLEWLPVSSSGQTTLVMVDFMGIRPELAISFGLAVHIGTAAAVFARYPGHLVKMLDIRMFTNQKKFYWTTTIISLICALPILFLLEQTFDSQLWTGMTITLFIGAALILTGIMLGRRPKGTFKPISAGSYVDYAIVGLAQAFAVLPGVSRSGMTITTLLMRKFRETEALVFSFLLSIPVSIASFAYFVVFGEMTEIGIWLLIIAAISSFIFGYISMSVLVKVAKNVDFSKFCMVFGSLAISMALLFWLMG